MVSLITDGMPNEVVFTGSYCFSYRWTMEGTVRFVVASFGLEKMEHFDARCGQQAETRGTKKRY